MIEFDLRDFERKAKEIGAAIDQVPFALAGALNTAAFNTRRVLTERTWPSHVIVRKRNFLTAALQVETAAKGRLQIAIVDKLGRAHLGLHAKGGTKQAKGRLAIPTTNVRRGSGGVVQSQRPGNLKRSVRKGNLIFQAQGRGKSAKLVLMYKLAPSARIKKDVPFLDDFEAAMRADARTSFPAAMARAMKSRTGR